MYGYTSLKRSLRPFLMSDFFAYSMIDTWREIEREET